MTTKANKKHKPTVERNGRVMTRCQARSKRTGEQCTQAARKDQRVCHVHGGSRKREVSGGRKPMGRPPTHGLYSKRGYTDIQDLTETVCGRGRYDRLPSRNLKQGGYSDVDSGTGFATRLGAKKAIRSPSPNLLQKRSFLGLFTLGESFML